MSEGKNEERIRKLQKDLAILREENETLSGLAEDVSLFGVVSEKLGYIDSEKEVVRTFLEDIALVKEIAYVSCFYFSNGYITVVEDYGVLDISLKGKRVEPGKDCLEIMSKNQHFAGLGPGLFKPRFIPVMDITPAFNSYYTIYLPFKTGQALWFLFVNNKGSKAYLEKMTFLLDRVRHVVQARVEAIRTLELLSREVEERKAAEEELAKTAASLEKSQQIAHIGTWEWNLSTGESWWSDECYRLFGLKAQEREISAEAFMSFVHPDDREMVNRAMDKLLKNHQRFTIEFRIKMDDGQTRIHRSIGDLILAQDNSPLKMVGTAQDVTEARQAEEAYRKSQERYRLIVEGVNVIGWEYNPFEDIFTFISSKAGRLLGYPVESWYEKGFWARNIHPDDVSWAVNYCQTAFQKGEDHDFEYRMQKADGGYVWLRDIVQVVFSQNGQPMSMRGIMIDITERKGAEEALAQSEETHRLVLNSAVEGVYGVDLDGLCTFANGSCANMLGYETVGQLTGKNMHNLIHHSHQDGSPYPMESCHIYKAFREARETSVSDEVFWRADGTCFPVEYWSKPIQKDGKAIGSVVSFVDITERKKTEERLREAKTNAEEATRLKDKFVSLVAHDLKAPLATSQGFLHFLQLDKKNKLAPEHQEIVSRVHDSSLKMLEMIDELLNISRFRTGNVKINKRFISPYHITMGVFESLSFIAQEKEIEMGCDIREEMRIFADYDLLLNVLRNLVSNALKFSDRGGKVTVRAFEKPCVRIEVRDTGKGVAPELLPLLFSHEEKTSTLGTSGEAGTGLGLPYSKDIVEAHGGRIYVETQKGNGSSFFVELPIVNPTVLIADDEPTVRILIKALLDPLNVEFKEAENGAEALALMEQTPPHLLISDIKMPLMDGGELIRRTRKNPELRHIPVLVATTMDMDAKDKLFELGADDFVQKPFAAEEFVARVRRLLYRL